MLQFNQGNVAGKLIAFGQAIVGDKNSEIVHAGVMFDKYFMIEALNSGISANDLRVGNTAVSYRVYRPHNAMLGVTESNVVKFLFDHHSAHGSMPYTYVGAVGAIGKAKTMSSSGVDARLDAIFALKPTAFFCSQFVVMSYQLAAAQMGMTPSSVFALDDAKMPPSRLATCCEQSVAFDYIGYMSPNER